MPEKITHLHAVALPLLRNNVDTDELVPVSENTRATTVGWGDGLFAARRYLDARARIPDPGFILNQAPYNRAAILVAGANFGCGSSRESAVWALRDFGFRVVIAASFNETFKRNCIINGVAPLVVARADAERLATGIMRDKEAGLSVDLTAGTIHQGDDRFAFELDPFYAALLTSGRTEDDILAELQPAIDARRAAMLDAQPWLRSVNDLGAPATVGF